MLQNRNQQLRFPLPTGASKQGDKMPVFNLTNRDSEPISSESFRGQPFVLTFVFTRCPVSSFCPCVSNNFEELQATIKTGSGTPAKMRLLSITLDLNYDTPNADRTKKSQ
jgi:protein SCO1